jgi:hypothetical protein
MTYKFITFIPSSMKIGQLVRDLKHINKHRHTERDIQPYIQTSWQFHKPVFFVKEGQ